MNFLKTLLWIMVSVLIAVFSINNWLPVTVNLWGGLQADIKLPILVAICFLAGLIPALIYYRTKSWRATRRLGTVERELADVRGFQRYRPPSVSAAPTPATAPDEPVGAGPAGPVTPRPISPADAP